MMTLRMATRGPDSGADIDAAKSPRRMRRNTLSRMPLRTRLAAIAVGTLLCCVLFGSAILWITHHASAAPTVTLALQQDTLRA